MEFPANARFDVKTKYDSFTINFATDVIRDVFASDPRPEKGGFTIKLDVLPGWKVSQEAVFSIIYSCYNISNPFSLSVHTLSVQGQYGARVAGNTTILIGRVVYSCYEESIKLHPNMDKIKRARDVLERFSNELSILSSEIMKILYNYSDLNFDEPYKIGRPIFPEDTKYDVTLTSDFTKPPLYKIFSRDPHQARFTIEVDINSDGAKKESYKVMFKSYVYKGLNISGEAGSSSDFDGSVTGTVYALVGNIIFRCFEESMRGSPEFKLRLRPGDIVFRFNEYWPALKSEILDALSAKPVSVSLE